MKFVSNLRCLSAGVGQLGELFATNTISSNESGELPRAEVTLRQWQWTEGYGCEDHPELGVPLMAVRRHQPPHEKCDEEVFSAVCKILKETRHLEFHLHAEGPEFDTLNVRDDDVIGDAARLRKCDHNESSRGAGGGIADDLLDYLRGTILTPWRALCPDLSTVQGSFEWFNPGYGANMGWHRDGHMEGEYLSHYYPTMEAGAARRMGWFEVALPPLYDAISPEEDDSGRRDVDSGQGPEREGEGALSDEDDSSSVGEYLDLDFLSACADEDERSRIAAANFVPLNSAEGELLIFEDRRCFHRTPLFFAGEVSRRRPIIRINFCGRSSCGTTVLFRPPPAHIAPWKPVGAVALPPGLAAFCQEHSNQTSEGIAAPAPSVALDEYLRGSESVYAHIKAKRRQFLETKDRLCKAEEVCLDDKDRDRQG